MRIVSIGDIGPIDDMFHVGDEAMFESLALELRARGVSEITALSSNTADTAARYHVDAIANFGFTGDRALNDERMAAVLGGQGAAEIRAAVEGADAVVVAGGGNMTSIWPSHIYERATLAALAASLGVPVVVSGQTIGPRLDEQDAPLVAGLLQQSALFSVRERDSLALTTRLGRTATLGPDDASFLADRTSTDEPLPLMPYALVSLASHTAAYDQAAVVTAIAELLDGVARRTAVVFSAHFAPLDGPPRGDELMHERVRSAMTQPSMVVRVRSSAASARLARGAQLVISSRYHPVVFAVSGGVPSIGIPVDDYTTTKLTGALGNFGQTSVLPAADLLAGAGEDLVHDVWQARAVIRDQGLAEAEVQRALSEAWWDSVAAV